MCDCHCHDNYNLDTLVPMVGIVTDIRQETPDVKTFRVNAPEAKAVAVDICSKVYPMTRNENGEWAVTVDPQEPGFHYYFLIVDVKRISDPSSQHFYGCSTMASAIDIPEEGCDFYLPCCDVPRGEVRSER